MSWADLYSEIIEEIDRLFNDKTNGCHTPFFRGLSNNSHTLLPTLFRDIDISHDLDYSKNREMTVFYDFETNSAILHSNCLKESWEVLYEMRHHEIPTRLLDWTGSFTVALYFALRKHDEVNTPCVWMLNPVRLNIKSVDKPRIISIEQGQSLDYKKMFVTLELEKKVFKNPIAINPVKRHPRVIAQNSYFTVHGSNLNPLEKIYSTDVVKRFDIPKDIIPDAKKFLKLANMNEFSLFPDFDGLGRRIKEIYFSK